MNYLKIILAGGLLLLNVPQQPIAAEGEIPMSKPPLPKGKLVRELKPQEAWELTIQFTVSVLEPAPDGKSQMRKTRERVFKAFFNRSGETNYINISNAQGDYQYWTVGTDLVYINPSEKARLGGSFTVDDEENLDELEEASERSYTELSELKGEIFSSIIENKFPFCRWIKPKHYIGVEQLFERDCLVFTSGNTKAWVDLANRQPLQWIQGNQKVLFQKIQSPKQIQFPSEVAAIFEQRKKDRAAIYAPPKRGG